MVTENEDLPLSDLLYEAYPPIPGEVGRVSVRVLPDPVPDEAREDGGESLSPGR